MAGYYIQGLLNTETAWDSYCTYGYKSDIDKRYFCAVQTSNIFYASLRESAYINIYIYCKGQQVSTLKCISNTGSEYNVSTMSYSTADPTVTRIYEHDVWSNMNGRQATIADFLSNAPILNGVNLSDAERDALAINYLNNVPEPYGQGTVTLSIKRPGQTLNFASRLLSKTVSEYISGNVTINMNVPVIVHDFPVQSFTTDYVFEKAIASYEIQTANAFITISQTNADPYAKRRFMQSSSDRRFSAAYKLNISGCSFIDKVSEVQQRQHKIYAYDERNSGTSYTYNTKATIIEIEDVDYSYASSNKYVQSSVETEITSIELEAGIYFICSSIQLQGDSYIKYGFLKDKTNNVRLAAERNSAPYGYSSIILADLVSVDSAITLSAYGYFYSGNVYASMQCVKLTGNLKYRTFTGTTSTSLSSVYSLSVSAGKYIVVSEIEFNTTSGTDIYSQVSYGGNAFVSDSGCDTTFDTPILHSVGYITVTSDGQLVVSVKTGTSGISISGYIKALKIA